MNKKLESYSQYEKDAQAKKEKPIVKQTTKEVATRINNIMDSLDPSINHEERNWFIGAYGSLKLFVEAVEKHLAETQPMDSSEIERLVEAKVKAHLESMSKSTAPARIETVQPLEEKVSRPAESNEEHIETEKVEGFETQMKPNEPQTPMESKPTPKNEDDPQFVNVVGKAWCPFAFDENGGWVSTTKCDECRVTEFNTFSKCHETRNRVRLGKASKDEIKMFTPKF